ncbi:MAG: sensor domain-containing diguanylate cyclase [Thermodesulfobacteriota bacterium]
MRINIATSEIINRILQRKKWHELSPEDVDLKEMLTSILERANEFVPSESGSIFIDDPVLDENREKPGKLYFVACYGIGSKKLAGAYIPADTGIVGNAYRNGRPYISKHTEKDPLFSNQIDKKTKYSTKSIICVPIKIRGVTVGVLELINRVGCVNYSDKDLDLLNIFAGYTSTLIQNSLDAKRFADMAATDNLTGLFNDRHFYLSLSEEVAKARKSGKDVSLIFMDLDRFKEINDTHGHLAGSQLLREVGGILAGFSDRHVCTPVRYGGDEFTLILPGRGVKKTRLLAEGLRKTIEGFVFLEKRTSMELPALKIKNIITISMGVASIKKNVRKILTINQTRDAIIKAADEAMYESKQNGKNIVTVSRKVFPIE